MCCSFASSSSSYIYCIVKLIQNMPSMAILWSLHAESYLPIWMIGRNTSIVSQASLAIFLYHFLFHYIPVPHFIYYVKKGGISSICIAPVLHIGIKWDGSKHWIQQYCANLTELQHNKLSKSTKPWRFSSCKTSVKCGFEKVPVTSYLKLTAMCDGLSAMSADMVSNTCMHKSLLDVLRLTWMQSF